VQPKTETFSFGEETSDDHLGQADTHPPSSVFFFAFSRVGALGGMMMMDTKLRQHPDRNSQSQ
jgi:hypothetical protein